MAMVCGIDLGTSAVRALVCDLQGTIRASASCDLTAGSGAGGRREQDPQEWWEATRNVLEQVTTLVAPADIGALAVDATSGTIVPVDRDLRPLGPGLMYNDRRAAGYARIVNDAAPEFIQRHGYRFEDSFALPKMLWLRDHDPAFDRTWKILHQSDFINARLMGDAPGTDWSTALKSGCDLLQGGWGQFIADRLHFPLDKLPSPVVASGMVLGAVCATAAAATGLKPGTLVVAGATDGTAALFASGACRPGDFNTTLGSTLVLKGIAQEIVRDPEGVVYCHRHPSGFWLPGGASNVGCTILNRIFAPEPSTRPRILGQLDHALPGWLPSPVLTYPLGDLHEERFPFHRSGLNEFVCGESATAEARYAALLQGIAFVERWCYEKLGALGAAASRIFSTGGGTRSRPWCQLRADVLQKTILLPAEAETALGAAVLAATHLCGSFERASAAMVRIAGAVEPGPNRYEELYHQFRGECRKRWAIP